MGMKTDMKLIFVQILGGVDVSLVKLEFLFTIDSEKCLAQKCVHNVEANDNGTDIALCVLVPIAHLS